MLIVWTGRHHSKKSYWLFIICCSWSCWKFGNNNWTYNSTDKRRRKTAGKHKIWGTLYFPSSISYTKIWHLTPRREDTGFAEESSQLYPTEEQSLVSLVQLFVLESCHLLSFFMSDVLSHFIMSSLYANTAHNSLQNINLLLFYCKMFVRILNVIM